MTDFTTAALHYVVNGHPPEMTLRQLALFGWICGQPGLSTRTLAAGLNVSPPVVTRAVRTLEGLGLVENLVDPMDGRRRRIVPTGKGLFFRRALERLVPRGTFPSCS